MIKIYAYSTLIVILGFASMGCQKKDEATPIANFSRGSALVTAGVKYGVSAYVNGVQDQNMVKAFYAADGSPLIPGNMNLSNGFYFAVSEVNFDPTSGQVVMANQVISFYLTTDQGGPFRLNLPLVSGFRTGQGFNDTVQLKYADLYGSIDIYGNSDSACNLDATIYFTNNNTVAHTGLQTPAPGQSTFLGTFRLPGGRCP